MTLRFNIDPFWDDSYKHLNYTAEPFNNVTDTEQWLAQGYPGKFVGAMCDMRQQQPSWNEIFINKFRELGWKDIGTSYYKMTSGTILPQHQDTYQRYVKLFNLYGKEKSIHRAIVFLEHWSSGHYLEIDGHPVVNWSAGDVVVWTYDTPHLAANMGIEPRYTLQVTGHIDEN